MKITKNWLDGTPLGETIFKNGVVISKREY